MSLLAPVCRVFQMPCVKGWWFPSVQGFPCWERWGKFENVFLLHHQQTTPLPPIRLPPPKLNRPLNQNPIKTSFLVVVIVSVHFLFNFILCAFKSC